MDDLIEGMFKLGFWLALAALVVYIVFWVVTVTAGVVLTILLPTYWLMATWYFFSHKLGAGEAMLVAWVRRWHTLWLGLPAALLVGTAYFNGGPAVSILLAYNVLAWAPVVAYVLYQIGYGIYLVGLRVARWVHYRRLPDLTKQHLLATGEIDLAAIERDAPLAILSEIPVWWKSQNFERRSLEAMQRVRGGTGRVVSRINPLSRNPFGKNPLVKENKEARDTEAAAVVLETYAEYQREAGEREVERQVEEMLKDHRTQ